MRSNNLEGPEGLSPQQLGPPPAAWVDYIKSNNKLGPTGLPGGTGGSTNPQDITASELADKLAEKDIELVIAPGRETNTDSLNRINDLIKEIDSQRSLTGRKLPLSTQQIAAKREELQRSVTAISKPILAPLPAGVIPGYQPKL